MQNVLYVETDCLNVGPENSKYWDQKEPNMQ